MSTIQQSLIGQNQPTSVGLGDILDWTSNTVSKVGTIYEQVKTIGKSPEVTVEEPRAGTVEGKNVQNVDPKAADRGAETIYTVQKVIDQVKGLFNVGFPQDSPQPASTVTHDVGTSALPFGLSMGAIVIIGLLLLFMVKK